MEQICDSTSDKGCYNILQWEIKNFCSWCRYIHSEGIQSPNLFDTDFKLEILLYPKGDGQNSDCIEVHMRMNEDFFLSEGELCFISSDGSVIGRQELKQELMSGVFKFSPGPNFKEVVDRIQNNETLYGDRLIVRWRQNCSIPLQSIYLRAFTEIDVFHMFFKLNSEIINQPNFKNGGQELLSTLKYPVQEDEMGTIQVYAYQCFGILNFKITHNSSDIICTHISFSNGDSKFKTFEKRLMTRDDENRLLNPVRVKEINKNVSPMSLCLKVLRREKQKKFYYSLIFPRETDTTMMTDSTCLSEQTASMLTNATTPNQTDNNSMVLLSKELMCLYQDQDFSDFQLRCKNVTFSTHKNILSARSPVFKRMLSCNMQEATSGGMNVDDLDVHTLGLFLTFLYAGTSKDLEWEAALKLYYAADKYQVPSLMNECSAVLGSSVSISNVCDILSLADKHQDQKLTSVALNFILANYNDVLSSKEWGSFVKKDPELLLKTVTLFAEKRFVVVKIKD